MCGEHAPTHRIRFRILSLAPTRAEFDDRLDIDQQRDVIYCKKMPSAFFETALQSLCVWHQVDTVIMTGGSTSGCIRATAVDSLSRGYRTIVPKNVWRISTRATILRI